MLYFHAKLNLSKISTFLHTNQHLSCNMLRKMDKNLMSFWTHQFANPSVLQFLYTFYHAYIRKHNTSPVEHIRTHKQSMHTMPCSNLMSTNPRYSHT